MAVAQLLTEPAAFLGVIFALIFAISFHEAAHAAIAARLGDPTAKLAGRLTLNPLAHLDLLGSLFLIFAGFGWGKPVPVDEQNFRNPARDGFLTALAGPLSNLALAGLFGSLLRAVPAPTVYQVIGAFVAVNLVLAVFNLLPIPPLDGSKVIRLLWPRLFWALEGIGLWLLLGLVLLNFLGVPILSKTLFAAVDWLFKLIVGTTA